jgi:NADPH:quinone reductase-like Zn-dependent oxidoreductase
MKGAIVKKVGASLQVVSDLEVPEPAEDQILVKSIYAALNPVDAFMAYSGVLVVDWPLGLCVDAAGVVVKAGVKAIGPLGTKFEKGDEVCGCTRLGMKGYASGQEFVSADFDCLGEIQRVGAV